MMSENICSPALHQVSFLHQEEEEEEQKEKMVVNSGEGRGAIEAPLLVPPDESVEGMVDYNGKKARRLSTGGWRSASFIIGVEIVERFAFYGISCNLIIFLTGPLRQSTAAAAENVNAWTGTATMTPLLGAFIADSYLGRYRTILYSSILYILGLGLLTLSVTLTTSSTTDSLNTEKNTSGTSLFQSIFFFASLYLVAIAEGGHKACTQAFGADQFDGQHPEENKSKSSFFNWWYCGMCFGIAAPFFIVSYVQENLSWEFGIGIPCIAMVVALLVFVVGTKTYRYSINENEKSPFVRIAQVFVVAARNWRSKLSSFPVQEETSGIETSCMLSSNKFKFLDKALIAAPDNLEYGSAKDRAVCSASQVNEAKAILQLIPIWCACLVYAIGFSQPGTFFTKQGSTMDRKIGSKFQIPAASLHIFMSITTVFIMPIYDRVFVPIARVFTHKPHGITTLQRIGTGMFFSTISMIAAAVFERKRLETALNYGLVDDPKATVPMSIWWLVPQYVFFGVADAFTMVGLQEFFYDQVPNGLRSLGIALYLSILGIGSFLSGFLVSIIDKATSAGGRDSWVSNNLNKAHLDYLYWLLVGLSIVEMTTFIYFAKSYVYNTQSTP